MYEIKYRSENEMIDSGIDWLGEIPEEWNVIKLKHKALVKMGQSPDSVEVNQDGVGIPFFQGKAEFGSESPVAVNFCTKPTKLANKGDLLLSVRAPVGEMNIATEKCCIGRGLAAIEDTVNRLLKYQMIHSTDALKSVATGTTFKAISIHQLSNLEIVDIEKIEQQKIANFLDIKTAQFDSIISKKEKLIQKLEEAKKSLISEVVTGKVKIVDGKLVERDVSEMKDSGVEWLGMVPREWEVKRIKNLFDLRNERNSKKMDAVQILTLYTSVGVRKQEDVESRTGNKVRTVQDYKIVYSNDIVVNIILAWMGSIGVSKDKGVISPAYDIYKPLKGVNSKFYNYLFRTARFSGECFKYGRGIMLMRWRTYSNEFRSIYVGCPSEKEQNMITNYIDDKTHDIEIVIKQNKEQITKIKQAKKSLISEAVTGKIDLRDWEIIEEGEMQ